MLFIEPYSLKHACTIGAKFKPQHSASSLHYFTAVNVKLKTSLIATAPSNVTQVPSLQKKPPSFPCTSCSDPRSHDGPPQTLGGCGYFGKGREHAG